MVGASGYTGVELLRLLALHPYCTVTCVCAKTHADRRLCDVFPSLDGVLDHRLESFDADLVAQRAETAFCALPHGESAACVDALRARGLRVIDLSADFRLRDQAVYERWYGPHPVPARLQEAVYGLPELHREALREASLVASPGCYPTASLLAIAALLRAGCVESEDIIIDAKSGVSGAGRTPSAHTHFSEVADGIRAYGVTTHRHTPEIEQELEQVAGSRGNVRVTFTPHLVPMNRGILATTYARPTAGTSASRIREVLGDTWRNEPFVRVTTAPPDTAHVRGSNRAHVAAWLDERAGRVVAMAAIDNLVKGAAGQAIQAWNLSMGFTETAGLMGAAVFP